MKRIAIGVLFVWLAVSSATAAAAAPLAGTTVPGTAPASPLFQRPFIVTSQDHTFAVADDCEHFHTRNVTSFPATASSQEQTDVALQGVELLKVRSSEEGGVSIKGWDRPVARLTVCKQAVAFTQQQAQRTLGAINIFVRNGDISATGPEIDETQAWWVHMILRVPKSSRLDVTSSNGGIAIRNMSGRITARAKNGGISVASCAGDARINTQSGGIAIEKTSGRIDATTENGPISLKLENHPPLLEAQTADAGEIVCNPRICHADMYSANHKHLRIGSAAPSIRLSTTSAPIVILDQVR
jgi:DUF4097 and DUF4098 domain-containing protein YvlB